MDITSIRTEAEYKKAMGAIARYFENEPEQGTQDGNAFETLVSLIEAYEAKHFPADGASPALVGKA
jgi:HTH-type transcriptional regulator/antitoxin HigA